MLKMHLPIGIWTFAILLFSIVSPASAQSGIVPVYLDPPTFSLAQGQVATVSIKIDASGQPVDTAQVFLEFDPALLQVVDAAGSPAVSVEFGTLISTGVWTQRLLNFADNTTGKIGVAAGKGTPASGGADANSEFVLATIRFKAFAGVGVANISIDVEDIQSPQRTKVYSGGSEVTGPASGATITISTTAPSAPSAPAPAGVGGGGAGGYVSPAPSAGGSVNPHPAPVPTPIPGEIEPNVGSGALVPTVSPEFALLAPSAIEPQISEIPPEAANAEVLSNAHQPSAGQGEGSNVEPSGPLQSVSDILYIDAWSAGFRNLLLVLVIGLGLITVVGAVILNSGRIKQLYWEFVDRPP